MKKIVTFGEIMMRLNPEGYERFVQADKFETSYAGGEANVAVSLAGYGMSAAFVSKVPSHEIGQCAVNELRRFGVDTSMMVRGGERLGIYFCEKGASQRASKVIYDRAGSAISKASAADFDWEKIFEGADWFHFTGITPALGGELPAICLEACRAAKKLGVKVSCDLNFRKKLWSSKEAEAVMSTLMPYVNVCIANEEDAKDVFGIEAEDTDLNAGKVNHDGYISVARQLTERFGFDMVAITLRESISASDNGWAAMLYSDGKAYFSPTYKVHIVDRVGGGDSFGGGLIYSLLSGYDEQKAINFAVAASCLKHTIEHDFNLVSVAEVEALAGGNASGRVQR
ncbi:MAG: sugar kinase [Clostridia bacterium]|nr:sugar kinase [Clostridia bacterium]